MYGAKPFRDRHDAGRKLAASLERFRGRPDAIVLALPRGGVPVAAEVAGHLGLPLDVFLVRKLGIPGHQETAFGAVAQGDVVILLDDMVKWARLTQADIDAVVADRKQQLASQRERFIGDRPPIAVAGRTVLVVDDGLATGATMIAALAALRELGAATLVACVPVGSADAVHRAGQYADEVVCLSTPESFHAVGQWYEDFNATEDDEVRRCLAAAASRAPAHAAAPAAAVDRDIRMHTGGVALDGHLHLPPGCTGLVVFAHGSGSSRHSPRNRYVAEVLGQGGLGTLLFDLLTAEEEVVDQRTRELRFDIPLLAGRVAAVVDWLRTQPETAGLSLGLFGASTGAAAALIAAAARPAEVRAVVSRGGRPDLADAALGQVTAPTLMIVGSRDTQVLQLNEQARARMTRAPTELRLVDGATHLFEEPGTLQAMAAIAREFFVAALAPR